MEVARTTTCNNIARISVYRKATVKRSVISAIFVLLYAIVLPYAYNTMGEPLRRAIEEGEKLEAAKANVTLDAEAVISWGDDSEPSSLASEEDFSGEMEFDEVFNEEDEGIIATDEEVVENPSNTSSEVNGTTTASEDDEEPRPLPSAFLPDAGAVASLFMVISTHLLFHLMCRWFVWFDAMVHFSPGSSVSLGSYLLVQPHKHRGKAEICPVVVSTLSKKYEFEFQRQKFEYLEPGLELENEQEVAVRDQDDEDHGAEIAAEAKKEAIALMKRNGVVQPVRSKSDGLVKDYVQSNGLTSAKAVENTLSRYGSNNVTVESLAFQAILKEQLLSPLSMFQLFSAGLWLMDEYWQYTIFSLITIVMMEATTSFQRFRTMKQLKGLSPKPFEIPTYRCGKWEMVSTNDILPGDIICLSTSKETAMDEAKKESSPDQPPKTVQDTVPCDCLILQGSGVVNEATLTGESVPQMKDSLTMSTSTSEDGADRTLDMHGSDRVHVLFSGTTLISTTSGKVSSGGNKVPPPPKSGCVCLVLRTGFSSAQGELMQMIEFSTEEVSADSKETGLALLILLVFAMCSAGYVFKKGMEKGDRTTHELLLKCILIITSVVPRQLPVQMALAVNQALMALMKEGIFCTEPYRVPYSGKITHCLFDKTGTLTTDELVPVGVVNCSGGAVGENNDRLVAMDKADDASAMVLAACHSLTSLPDSQNQKGGAMNLLGDPIEVAALRGVEWRFDPKTQTSVPGNWQAKEEALAILKAKANRLKLSPNTTPAKRDKRARVTDTSKPASEQVAIPRQIEHLEKVLAAAKERAAKCKHSKIRILHRFHFASKLQRMSVICSATQTSGGETKYVLVKGSPEALEVLYKPDQIPSWFRDTYQEMAENGMRILAMGYRKLVPGEDPATLARADAEKNLEFAGFVAFECKTRADSAMVVESLRAASHQVSMITGDAALTALHVARITGICLPLDSVKRSNKVYEKARKDGSPLLLKVLNEEAGREKVEWRGALRANREIQADFLPNLPDCGLGSLSKKHDLLVTEDALLVAARASKGNIWSGVEFINVFARMSPQGKAKVIRSIQTKVDGRDDHFVLMCGDGGNDVGALKQSDVGLALLSGYGSANTGDDGANAQSVSGDEEGKDAESILNDKNAELKKKSQVAAKLKAQEFAKARKAILGQQRRLVEIELEKLRASGKDVGVMAQFKVTKDVAIELNRQVRAENLKLEKKYNIHMKKSSGPKTPEQVLEESLEQMEDPNGMPVVRPGDASVAAPFTSRTPSVSSVVTLIRQGRCTLLSALQQQQIMMLECTISAYCLAALSLEGARSSERQMMVSGWLVMTASVAFSYSTPVERMHPVRPVRSLFHPSVGLSVLGQAMIHLTCMLVAVRLATEAMGEEKLKEVVAFNRRVAKGEAARVESAEEEDPFTEMMNLWAKPFMPNLMNTVIFLVETSQIMAVLFVNYKGRPWMKGLIENHALFLSLFTCIGGIAFCAWEVNPTFNRMIHLEAFPDDLFRWKVMGLVALSLLGTFLWDRLMIAIFAPKAFKAMLAEAAKTSIDDVTPLFWTLGKVMVGLVVLGSGNPIIWGGAFMLYKWRKNKQENELIANTQL